jgi:hypothetical protein
MTTRSIPHLGIPYQGISVSRTKFPSMGQLTQMGISQCVQPSAAPHLRAAPKRGGSQPAAGHLRDGAPPRPARDRLGQRAGVPADCRAQDPCLWGSFRQEALRSPGTRQSERRDGLPSPDWIVQNAPPPPPSLVKCWSPTGPGSSAG